MKLNIWNFSGILKEQDFYKNHIFSFVDMEGLSGTNCYCDDTAKDAIRRKIRELEENTAENDPRELTIRFTDSGNYHYMSLLFQEQIEEDYVLCLWDNHPDLQEAAFGGITSCGGWVKEALEVLPHLKQVLIMGVEDTLVQELAPLDKRVTVVRSWKSKDEKDVQIPADVSSYIKEEFQHLPIYISVDKDVMKEGETACNWSQGVTVLEQLIRELKSAMENKKLLGMDVCGECDAAGSEGGYDGGNELNNNFNKKFIGILTQI